MTTLSARDAYPRWAATYNSETAVSRLEDVVLAELAINTVGSRLLDVGCGTGRRMRTSGARYAVGIDLSLEMLQQAEAGLHAVSDIESLPLVSNAFDVVWCRLVIGHLANIELALAELARVCDTGGSVVLSDLAPVAYAAGHRRTFRASTDEIFEVEHHVHDVDELIDVANPVGLRLSTFRIGVVDHRVRSLYDLAGALPMFEKQRGEELVHVMVFTKT